MLPSTNGSISLMRHTNEQNINAVVSRRARSAWLLILALRTVFENGLNRVSSETSSGSSKIFVFENGGRRSALGVPTR
jgi:hypothetical protein